MKSRRDFLKIVGSLPFIAPFVKIEPVVEKVAKPEFKEPVVKTLQPKHECFGCYGSGVISVTGMMVEGGNSGVYAWGEDNIFIIK